MSDAPKRGSSRRLGDEFQDLTALRLALELYSRGKDFKLFIEYEKVTAVDDVVTVLQGEIQAIQVKYAVDPMAVYAADDFTDPASKVYFGRLAEGWRKTQTSHPNSKIQVCLLSNRGRDSSLEGIIEANGKFAEKFVDGKVRKDANAFRKGLESACAFAGPDKETDFKSFLSSFEFRLAQRPLNELESQIVGEILDHQFGISERRIFHELKKLIERHALEIHEPITPALMDNIFHEAHSRFFLPQVFPVDHDRFVSLPAFATALTKAIEQTDSGYIVVTGLPGSGKSTSLSEFFDALKNDAKYAVCRYLCFVRPNDDALRLRLEAQALRVNLLSEFQSRFPDVFPRRHDYGERNFADALTALGEEATKQGLKLVVLLDGLDHAERDASVRDSVLDALPTSLPKSVVFVVGTQELKHWDVPLLKEARETRHISMPLFALEETRSFLVGKSALAVGDDEVLEIYSKSQGLPLYLHYVAIWLKQRVGSGQDLRTMPDAVNGDIREYYSRLWATFTRDGMEEARYLCGLFAALKFPIVEGEVSAFQDGIPLIKIPSALKAINHLLRASEHGFSIFHDSFRVFVNSVLDDAARKELVESISKGLANERGSGRWFSHSFQYAFDAGLDDYILKETNREFVEFALGRSRTPEEILSAISLANKAAERKQDLLEIARLGTLEARTTERVQHQMDMAQLARAQLALGRIDDVLHICCRPSGQSWEVETTVALRAMIWLAASNRRDLGEKLLRIFRKTHEGYEWDQKHEILLLAQVAGTYFLHPARFLRFASRRKFNPEILARPDLFAPAYCPQLDCFLGACFNNASPSALRRFKRVKRLFSNHLIRHILLRLVEAHRSKDDLKTELEDYLANTPTTQNLEVAGLAALAGLPVGRVRALAGQIKLPPRIVDRSTTMSAIAVALETFHWTALVVGYERDQTTIERVLAHIGTARTMWSGFLRFQFGSRLCVAQAPCDTPEITAQKAISALEELSLAGEEESSQEMEVLRHSRELLPDLIGELTDLVAQKSPDKLDLWADRLLKLRQTEMWTSHWSISESSVNYSFELSVWDRLQSIHGMSSRLLLILEDCAKTYEEATSLKGGARTDHLMWLSTIAAKCGWRDHAEKWKAKALACSLTYGYHKDITLEYLTDTLEMLTRYEPEHGLKRSAAILEMSKWMRDVTDERETLHFEISVFDVVLQSSREAAFALIRFFRENNARWSTLDCLEKYVHSTKTGDTEVLWILKDAFTPHFVERGRHPHQITRAAHTLAELGAKLEPSNTATWRSRYGEFVRTHIDPGWWPEDVWNTVKLIENRTPMRSKDPYTSSSELDSRSFKVGGSDFSQEEILRRMEESVDSFCITLEQLLTENEHFYRSELINKPFIQHIGATKTLSEVRRLAEVARNGRDKFNFRSLQAIANRLFELGDSGGGFQYLLDAYKSVAEYRPGGGDTEPILRELCKRDKSQTLIAVAARASGADAPRSVARFYAACDDVEPLRKVFEDFLQQCEELFANLPPERRYGWLRDYKDEGRDEAREIVEFVIDLLAEPEIDQATRLSRVLTNLARERGSLVCEICTRRILTAEPILRERLESLLTALSGVCPWALVPHLDQLLPLLEKPHFKLRMTIASVIKIVGAATPLSSMVTSAEAAVERAYSPLIAYPSRGSLLVEASASFVEFARRGALFYFRDKLSAVSEVLNVEEAHILGYIERRLVQKGWTSVDEEKRLRKQWESNSFDEKHVWFVSEFHQSVWDLLQEFLHSTLENGRFRPSVVSVLWNIMKGADPEWLETLPNVKPTDIPALIVNDGPKWIGELRSPAPLLVERLEIDGWTTIFEERQLTQRQDAGPRFVSNLRVYSLLVSPACANKSQSWPATSDWLDTVPLFHREENITASDMRKRILEVGSAVSDTIEDFLPLTAVYLNELLFNGYRRLASLHPTWIGAFGLELMGTSAFLSSECVVEFDTWQEGYEDDVYSRDVLSAGSRLRIKNSCLRQILSRSMHSLVLRTTEARTHHEGWFSRKKEFDVTRETDKMLFV